MMNNPKPSRGMSPLCNEGPKNYGQTVRKGTGTTNEQPVAPFSEVHDMAAKASIGQSPANYPKHPQAKG